jgi:ribonuclease D
LPLRQYQGEVVVIDRQEDLADAFRDIEQHSFVGFDTETKPTFVKGDYNHPSLLQVAVPERVYLIRLLKTGMAAEVVDFFQQKKIEKIGLALHNDISSLQKMHAFEPSSIIDLAPITTEIGIEANGLRKLTALVLGFRISKSGQLTNWEAETLAEKQLRYAATDAWVCLEIYQLLRERGKI